MKLSTETLKTIPVFGIAGNFAEHLAQAGEASDFVGVKTECEEAPKGLFPVYIPGMSNFLGVFPLSSSEIKADFSQNPRLQIEPELALLFDVDYTQNRQIEKLRPSAFAAFNDCSNRIQATKISIKKNWGSASTGLAEHWIELDQFSKGGLLDQFHIACYLKRDEQVYAYGIDSPVAGYSYCHQQLVDWMVQQFNHQPDVGPLESLMPMLTIADYPGKIIVSLGATRYSALGETTYLQPGDQLGVFVYAPEKLGVEQLVQAMKTDTPLDQAFCSSLIQTVQP
ncbi:hypothetical protein JX580_05395 [Thiomicrospira microaerophila]|uniref:DUF5718 family protein n=1 Tax=Thiomicrospira microaerophila TaxID=406020 RepID=UPI002010B5B2|nr:DUF5718 family protein [Thiomicrospira microaerophila]UQB43305.1 hypothetical protein JX580_05395 [Thiomicrospira microaerophila]